MDSVVARGRRVLATFGSVVLGAGLAVTLAPSAGASFPAADTGERPAPAAAPAGPAAKALADALPARLGAAQFTSVYGDSTVNSSTGKKMKVALGAYKSQGSEPSFAISLSRGNEQHSWYFPGPNSSFDISPKGAGKLVLAPKKTGGMGKIALKVKPDGKMKSNTCGGGKVYAKTRNVVISGTFFFDSGSKWGKVGSKKKPFKFQSQHQVSFSFDVNCPTPPAEEPTCYDSLSWWAFGNNTTLSGYKAKKDSKATIYASRWTKLAKPKGASRSDSVWGTGSAPELTKSDTDDSASMKVYAVRGSGTITAPPMSSYASEADCDKDPGSGTQHTDSWWGNLTNGATPLKVPAQVFGSFTVPNGADAYMSKAWFD